MYQDYIDAGFKLVKLHNITEENLCDCRNCYCENIGKHPCDNNYQNKELSDDDLVYIEQSTGFGVLCSGFLIVDIDPRNGGEDGYKELTNQLGIDLKQIAGFSVKTGGGGWHLYFRCSTQDKLSSKIKTIKGIDFKSNGFVVGATSHHESGMIYDVEPGKSLDYINEAPHSLISLLKKKTEYVTEFKGISPGVNENKIKKLLAAINPDADYDTWLHVGMAIHHTFSGLGYELWDEWSSKGAKYKEGETEKKWHSFGKYDGKTITYGTLHHIALQHGYVPEFRTKDNPNQSCSHPVKIDDLDPVLPPGEGVLIDVIEWINDQCRYPRENLAMASGLCAIGQIAGMRFYDETYDVTSNLLSLNVAGSGTGKEAVLQATMELLREAGFSGATAGAIKSQQEIVRNLLANQSIFYMIDEIGITLSKIASGTESYLKGVIGEIMSVFSKANAHYLIGGDLQREVMKSLEADIAQADKIKNGDKKQKKIAEIAERMQEIETGLVRPLLSLIGFTTPETFSNLINRDNASSGFVGRALITQEKETVPLMKRNFKKRPLSMPLAMSIRNLAWGDNPVPKRKEWKQDRLGIPMTDDAIHLLEIIQFWKHDYAEHHKQTTGLEAVVLRVFEMVLKISFIQGVGSKDKTIDESHVRWAYLIARRDLELKLNMVLSNREKDDVKKDEEILNRLLAELDQRTGATVPFLSNRIRKYNAEQIQYALDHLAKADKVFCEAPAQKRGRPGSPKWYLK